MSYRGATYQERAELNAFRKTYEALSPGAKRHAIAYIQRTDRPFQWDTDLLWPAQLYYERASGLLNNVRNLEHLWRAVFVMLLRMATRLIVGFDLGEHEEHDVWVPANPEKVLDPNDTLRLSSDNVEWRRPDVVACLYVLRQVQSSNPASGIPVYELFNVLVACILELKRAISRQLCDAQGWPVSEAGCQALAYGMQDAMRQSGIACELYLRTPAALRARQDEVLAMVTVGPICCHRVYKRRSDYEDYAPDELIAMYNDQGPYAGDDKYDDETPDEPILGNYHFLNRIENAQGPADHGKQASQASKADEGKAAGERMKPKAGKDKRASGTSKRETEKAGRKGVTEKAGKKGERDKAARAERAATREKNREAQRSGKGRPGSIRFEMKTGENGSTFAWPSEWSKEGWQPCYNVLDNKALSTMGNYLRTFRSTYAAENPAGDFEIRPKVDARPKR